MRVSRSPRILQFPSQNCNFKIETSRFRFHTCYLRSPISSLKVWNLSFAISSLESQNPPIATLRFPNFNLRLANTTVEFQNAIKNAFLNLRFQGCNIEIANSTLEYQNSRFYLRESAIFDRESPWLQTEQEHTKLFEYHGHEAQDDDWDIEQTKENTTCLDIWPAP